MEEASKDIDDPAAVDNEVNDNENNSAAEEIVTFKPHTVLNKGVRSIIWKFFIFKGTLSKGAVREEVYCTLCSKETKLVFCGGTTSLWNHMKRHHEKELKDAESVEDKKKPDIRNFAVPSSSNNNVKTWCKTSARWKTATSMLTKWICVNNRPFSIVEDEGFRAALKFIQPEFDPPSASTISNYIDNMYKEEKVKLIEELKEIDFVAVTTDGGSSSNATSFQDLNVHYFDEDLKLKSSILTVQELKCRHTAENIREENDEVLEEYGVLDKVTLTVTDNEPKMGATYDDSERSGCMAHIEHKSIEKGVEEVKEVTDVIEKVRRVSQRHNKSYLFKNALRGEQARIGLKVRPLIQDVVNRWGSTKAALESYLTHKDDLEEHLPLDNIMAVNSAIRKTVTSKKLLEKLLLTASDMMIIENVHKLLTSLDVYTTTLGGNSFVTSSVVIPVMKSIESLLKVQDNDPGYMEDLKTEIFQDFKTRCTDNLNVDILMKCSALDPRFKSLKFMKNKTGEREKVFDKILKEMVAVKVVSKDTSTDDKCSSPKKRKLGLLYNESDDEEEDEDKNIDLLKIELENYRKEPKLDEDIDAIEWWKARRFQYPTLIQLVRKYLCIPATSTQAERVFSKLGLTLTKQRLCMSSSNVDKVLFLGDRMKV